jgi:hypothetical protein
MKRHYFELVPWKRHADRGMEDDRDDDKRSTKHQKSTAKGDHWYCGAVAVDFRDSAIYLCEVTYAKGLVKLLKRLAEWEANWPAVVDAVHRESKIPSRWSVTPWLFIPQGFIAKAKLSLLAAAQTCQMPTPRITALETLVPWNPERWPSLRAAKSKLIEGTTSPSEVIHLDSARKADGMWIFTKYGFFSAVCARVGDGPRRQAPGIRELTVLHHPPD